MAQPARLEVEVIKAVRVPIPPSFLRRLLQRAAALPEVEARLPDGTATVAVRLTGDEELRRLNRDYAGLDAVTDVLSFEGARRVQGAPLTSRAPGALSSSQHLGDLAISWPAAARQAHEYRHPETTELGLLAVHGLLHLLGWDHATVAQRKEMSRITVAALAHSGLKPATGRL